MRTQAQATLRKCTLRFSAICMLNFSAAAFAQEASLSKHGLESALEKAVMCKVNALDTFGGIGFEGGADDPRPMLEALGVRINENSTTTTARISYYFPPGIKVFGYEVSEAKYFDSGMMIFFVSLRAGSDRLPAINKTLRLAPVAKGNPDRYGLFDEIDVRYIRKLSDDKSMPPDTIFSGTGSRQNYVVIGCQNLSW